MSTDGVTRITVLNDYREFLDLMVEVLQLQEGHEVHGFSSSEVSLADVVASRPDVLIIDLTAVESEHQDWEPTKIRATAELQDLPIILCSADVIAIRDRAEELRNDDLTLYLEKPFTIDQLREVMKRALDGR